MNETLHANTKAFMHYFARLLLVEFFILLVFASYSRVLGLNLVTFFLFWIIILPLSVIYLSSKLLSNRFGILNGIGSLILFYAFMTFMTYSHFQTDFFSMMMISLLWNLLIMTAVFLSERDGRLA